jgi:hypothetical protein
MGGVADILRRLFGSRVCHDNQETLMDIAVGSAAPDFSVGAHNSDQPVSLSAFRGRPVVVAFMPFAFTGG